MVGNKWFVVVKQTFEVAEISSKKHVEDKERKQQDVLLRDSGD